MSRILSLEQKIFIVKWYYKKNESLPMVESQFSEAFHFNPILTVFDHVLRAFEATGSVIEDVSYVIDEGQPNVSKELHDCESDRALEVAQEDGSEDLSEVDTSEGATIDHHSGADSSEASEPASQPRRMGRPRKPIDNLTCGICSKECKSRRSYLGHLKLHGAKEYVCSVCNYACSTRKYLKVHEQKHVPMEERIRMECKLCHRVYTNKSAFNNHRASHRKVARVEEPSVCTICAKVYSSRKYLTAHMKHFHRDSCTYDCLVCRRSFKTHGNLREHQETHKSAEEREKVECDICHATLLRQCLRKHMKYMHGEDKDWVCEVCGKSMRKGAIKVYVPTPNIYTDKMLTVMPLIHGSGTYAKSHGRAGL